MKLEEKYLKKNIFESNNIEFSKILKASDKLVTKNMQLVSKFTDQLMKEVERQYIKNSESISPIEARDIFLSSYISSYQNYIDGIKKSLKKI